MEKKMGKLNNILQKVVNQNMFNSFKQIMLVSRLKNYDNKLKIEHEKITKEFANILQQKDEEIQNFVHLKEEQNLNINHLKAKESENQLILKQKEQYITSLEQEYDIMKSKKINPQDLALSYKLLEKRLKDLEIENNDLRDKSVGTEGNVSFFIKEMNDLLDSHEISTNIGSDDNISLNNSNSNYQLNQIQNAIFNGGINQNNFNEFDDVIDTSQFTKKNVVPNQKQSKQITNKAKIPVQQQISQAQGKNLMISNQGIRQSLKKN